MKLGLILGLAAFAALGADAPGKFVSMFNGKDLAGWEATTPGVWSVKDGMIVGQSNGLKVNTFLRTKKSYKNFVMKSQFRMVTGEGNSGIQFRSLAPPPGSQQVAGFQADIGDSFWGCLYDEARRRKVLVQAPPETLTKTIHRTGWNDYVITADGNHITLQMNGATTVDYTEKDPAIAGFGIIALQLHAGKPYEVQFKNLNIRELP
ncbi:MAG: DUF1080 domain-containing protein [Acidobacteria bacterium]|nr:DUF1080 domain-containing protein [Acidobacteriota bacterium]